jgi:hypothetical protein
MHTGGAPIATSRSKKTCGTIASFSGASGTLTANTVLHRYIGIDFPAFIIHSQES